MSSKRLTDISSSTGLTLSDLIHIVNTGDTSQGNPAGSSYKATLNQVADAFSGIFSKGFTGGTVSGPTNFNSGLSANTLNTTSITLNGLTVTGFTNFLIGGSYSPSNSTLTLNTQGGTPVSITGLTFGGSFTGGTVVGQTTFSGGLSANTINVIGLTANTVNTTSFTLNGVTITGFTFGNTFTGNTSATCITDLYVSNLNSCSPLHIQNISDGSVLIGENGNVNVGIGTSTPNKKLTVTTSNTGDGIMLRSSTNDLAALQVDPGIPSSPYKRGYIALYNENSIYANVVFNTPYHTQSDYINTGLNLGIGHTFTTGIGATAKLHVVGSDSSSSNYGLKVQNSGGTDNFVVRNDGNVGIGTSTPLTKLQVVGGNLQGIYSTSTNDIAINGVGTGVSSYGVKGETDLGTAIRSNITNTSAIGLEVNYTPTNSSLLKVLGNGNVGIGTSSPSEKLDVSGKTKTINFQMTNGATNGYVLTSDASGNANWQIPTGGGGGIFTGGTVSGPTNFTNGLTANTLNVPSITLNGVNYTSFDDTVNLGTGLTVNFTGKTIFNLPDSPVSGNISGDTTNAKFGMIQKIYHQSSVEPTFPSSWKLVGEGIYFPNELNIIYAEYITNNWIEYWIIQQY